MAKTYTNPFTQTLKVHAATIVNATSFSAADAGTNPTNTVKLLTAGSEGTVVKAICMASNDTSARNIAFYWSGDGGTTKVLLCVVAIAATAGFTGAIANVDVLNALTSTGLPIINGLPVDQSGKQVLPLEAGDEIYIAVITAAVTANKTVYVTAFCEDF